MYLIFDTETTGFIDPKATSYTDVEKYPRIVQIAWQLHDERGKLLNAKSIIVKPSGFEIPFNATQIHGISTERALAEGSPIDKVLEEFRLDVLKTQMLVGHNIISYDIPLIMAEYHRLGIAPDFMKTTTFDTMNNTADFVGIPMGTGGRMKPPKLSELHQKLFGVVFADAHDAAYDVAANAKCFFELFKHNVLLPLANVSVEEIVYEAPVLSDANFAKQKTEKEQLKRPTDAPPKPKQQLPYAHLHAHSMYSVLQSTADIKKMIKYAKDLGYTALAITDLGNLFGAFEAVNAVYGMENFKLIIGLETFIAKERKRLSFTKDDRDIRYTQVLLAKNQIGYANLCKISSLGFIEGLYDGCARVDKDLIFAHKEGLIALSGGLKSEIAAVTLSQGETAGEEVFKWWKDNFQDDFYVTLQRHGIDEEEYVNKILLKWCAKYEVKYVAANESFYLEKKDAEAHDVLLCVKDGEKKSTPIGKGRGYRYGMPNQNFYMPTPQEVNKIFADVPEAIATTQEIADKCSTPKIKRDILLPRFDLPEGIATQDDYLRLLTYEGAKKRYPNLTPEIQARLDFELEVIKKMGFPGYFLIVQDFINQGRRMGVGVGPGRGSAAGSAVAYCIGITNIDPIKYNLLFERFLNPERVSMPDIDIDFDDRGRGDVIKYVIDRYGKNQVAQIITYGAMKAKSAIKDAARVLDLPLNEANALAKLVPETPDINFDKAFKEVPELENIFKNDKSPQGDTLRLAYKLEGCVRNLGVHAAGVIIAPSDLLEYIPVCTAKDAEMLVTQFEGKMIEDAGMLKMDFLGLKTLTIIKDALSLIKENHKIDIDIDHIPFDDPKTFELYQQGNTVGTFQFESVGMQKYLKQLKPTDIEDLIAMNALYRPGPLDYIPNYINRKHGREEIEYPHELLAPILKTTFGIMIYQEQIMQAAQIMAGYSLGGADLLRRAMGKKDKEKMAKEREKFIKGAKDIHNVPEKKAGEVFDIMEKFAGYGFNRSHAAAYSVVAYQTAYLKANYTAEYMAAVMTNSMGNIEKLSEFLEDCKNMNVKVLGPDVNESVVDFSVNKQGAIRFGLGAIKGAGEAAVQTIIDERKKNGVYKDIFDFVTRNATKSINKKVMEALAYSGAFDCFKDLHRAQYFYSESGSTGIEKLIKYAAGKQSEKSTSQFSLFGGDSSESGVALAPVKIPSCEPWGQIEALKNEKEVIGIYISGHPLDMFKMEMQTFCKPIARIDDFRNEEIGIGGIITEVSIRQTKTGQDFALFSVEDYDSVGKFAIFRDAFMKSRHLLVLGTYIYVRGTVKERYNSPGSFELEPKELKLLSELSDKFNKIVIKVPINIISEQFVNTLNDLAELHKGKGNLNLEVFDEDEKISLNFFSRKYKINPTKDLLDELNKIAGISCSF
jgi:DNA polymerase-3 subunit alpha